jgi:hypothetical protein
VTDSRSRAASADAIAFASFRIDETFDGQQCRRVRQQASSNPAAGTPRV